MKLRKPSKRKLENDLMRMLKWHDDHPRVLKDDHNRGIIIDTLKIFEGKLWYRRGRWRNDRGKSVPA